MRIDRHNDGEDVCMDPSWRGHCPVMGEPWVEEHAEPTQKKVRDQFHRAVTMGS